MSKRKKLLAMLGVLLLGALLYFAVWPYVFGESSMQAFCQSLAKDAPIARVRESVQQHRFRMTPPDKAGRSFIHDPRSFGRYICEVQFREAQLSSARYQRND